MCALTSVASEKKSFKIAILESQEKPTPPPPNFWKLPVVILENRLGGTIVKIFYFKNILYQYSKLVVGGLALCSPWGRVQASCECVNYRTLGSQS